jgi:N-acyl-D-aspartate/D-glutamate deacylase
VRQGFYADLVLFNADEIRDVATFDDPIRPAQGIVAVWVNGIRSYSEEAGCLSRAGRFLAREPHS